MALIQSQKDYFDAALDDVDSTTSVKTFFESTKNPPDTVNPPGPKQTFIEGMLYLSQRASITSEQKAIITNTLSSFMREADFLL